MLDWGNQAKGLRDILILVKIDIFIFKSSSDLEKEVKVTKSNQLLSLS